MYWYLNICIGCVIGASLIFPEPLWGIDGGWHDYRTCRSYLKDDASCRRLAESTFKMTFPAISYEWPACGKDDIAEAILWASLRDRVFVDRYMRQFRRLCGT